MVRNYFNYFTEVEEYFVQRRGKNLLVSPLDWCLIELWKENGIPLHVVMRGIDRSFEAATARGKAGPRNLYYCHPAIMEAFDEFQQGTLGSHSDSEESDGGAAGIDPEQITGLLRQLEDTLANRPEDPCRRGAERLKAMREELPRLRSVDLERLDRELAGLATTLVGELVKGLPAEVIQQIEADAKEELVPYRKRLSKQMFSRFRQRHMEKKFRDHFELPDFSLLRL